MPPKRKKGRPLGSKNKTSRVKVKTERNSDGEVFCTSCNNRFASQTELDLHIKTCKDQFILRSLGMKAQPSYNCQKCSKRFKFIKSYADHMKNEHSTSPGSVSCKQCSVVCPDRKELANHVSRFHERLDYECEHCGKKFARHSHVLRHMSQKGCDGRDKIVYPCEICSKTFTRKDNLMVHLRLKHIEKKEFACKHCTYCSKNFSRLVRHNQRNHSDNNFECDHCGKIVCSRAAISKHLEIHGSKKFNCDVCGYKSFTIEVMRRHVLTHVPEKPYKCSVCKRSYIQKQQLQRHMFKHTGHMCSKCNLCFDTKDKFITHHYKEHIDLKNILCPFEDCVHATEKMANLEVYLQHINNHLDGKQYTCAVCNKRFNNEAYLRRHVSTHALERPRRCMYCVTARAYVRGEQLVRHVRKSHPTVFRERLKHVRSVLGTNLGFERVKKSELESILNVLDAESDRILEDYGFGVLYGGLQEQAASEVVEAPVKVEKASPLMSEEELTESVQKLLSQLIDHEMLEIFGWPDEPVDTVLEKVIVNCGARAADRDKWSRVQCLRENTKHLFVYVVEDKNIARMLHSHTIDQVIAHILRQVAPDTHATHEIEIDLSDI